EATGEGWNGKPFTNLPSPGLRPPSPGGRGLRPANHVEVPYCYWSGTPARTTPQRGGCPSESNSSLEREGRGGQFRLNDHPVCAALDASRHFVNAQPPLLREGINILDA